MNVTTLKDKFIDSIDLWLEKRVDDLLKGNPSLAIPSIYLKRGCHNIINKYENKISNSIDNVSLFIADENGNIDANTMFNDAMELFNSIDETNFEIGIVSGVVGKGKVVINIPDNIFTNIVFGSKKSITFNEDDFIELKSLLLEQE